MMNVALFMVFFVSTMVGCCIGGWLGVRWIEEEAGKRLDAELGRLDRQLKAYRK